jgi:glycosyltransferase involved in cell wall biosynthesis
MATDHGRARLEIGTPGTPVGYRSMRVTLVSAHYPPNFVSGGTLQPQRIAHGLVERGHDVRVFAGCLDSRRQPLATWTDADEIGVPVTWLVTTPWIGWADERNYDNPEAAEVFRSHLAAHPADVVHLHSLQGLGVGLVEAAKEAGARTVVTMHDFWWVCARQFLVDREMRPCCLVVAAGDCACEDGRAHLDRRTARVGAALASADHVLAPSRSATEVLRANGVPADRLRVDENGMLGLELAMGARRPRTAGTPVTVRYTGGSNPMKGVDVLLDAAHELGPMAELRILAHGIDDAVARDRRSLSRTAIEPLPPYAPEELDEVLSSSDVLVLPSVARESHSMVTREALLHGLPIITTDTIGPEEVVADGVNGLVVPAGDSHLLAAAIREVLDPIRLAALAAGAEVPPPVRRMDEQVDGLAALYTEPLPSVRASQALIHQVLFIVGIDGAPLRYRAHLPAEALRLRGVGTEVLHYRDPRVAAQSQAADVVVLYRVPATQQILELVASIRITGTAVVFDVDDLIFDPDIASEVPALRALSRDESQLWLEGVRRYRTTMEACDAFIGSTPRLVEHARTVVDIDAHLFENGVGMALGVASDIALRQERAPGPPRVGYFSGTTTHDDDWRFVEPAVVEVLGARPGVELWLGGHLQPTSSVIAALGARVRRLPFLPWQELPARLRQLDVNLAPLVPGSRFNDAKSAIKWLEAALVATPTIATPSAPFVDVIEPGRTGWLAEDPEEWAATLAAVLDDAEARTRVGVRAQRAALLRWSPHRQGARYLDILETVRASTRTAARRQPSPAWVPVALDEPALTAPPHLEPYPPSLTGSTRERRRPRQRTPVRDVVLQKRARLRESIAEEGVAGVVRGAGRVAARAISRATRR